MDRKGARMLADRYEQAQWLEWSGLPAALNQARAGSWAVFKKLVELDCGGQRGPGTVEISLAELGERCGFAPEAVAKILETLRKKKVLRCYLPDNHDEPGLFEIRVPLKTPRALEQVAARVSDPHLRDPTTWRYAAAEQAEPLDEKKVQAIVDLYLNHLSQKMNLFILEQIEIAARRFTLEEIRLTIERAERHELRNMGWVLKELIRDHAKQAKDPKPSNRL